MIIELRDVLASYSDLPEYLGKDCASVASVSLFGDYPINIAATRGKPDELVALLEAGADINQRGEHGYTPLHNAVEQGHISIVKYLLKRGAIREIINNDGQTPEQLARILGENRISSVLRVASNR